MLQIRLPALSAARILLTSSILLLCSCTQQSSPDSIDLSQNDWLLAPGFEDQWALHGIAQHSQSKIVRQPIVVAQHIAMQPGSRLLHYTIQTAFTLPARGSLRNPALYLDIIGENWEVFLNGHSLQRQIFTNTADTHIEKYRSVRGLTVPIPASFLQKENLLVIHLIGSPPVVSWMPNSRLGMYKKKGYLIDDLQALQHQELPGLVFVYVVYAFFGIYHIVVFFVNTQERHNLWFGIFTVSLAVYFTSLENWLYHLWPDMNTARMLRLEYMSLFWLSGLFLLFTHSYFDLARRLRLGIHYLISFQLVLALMVLLCDFDYSLLFLRIWQYSFLPTVVYAVYIMLQVARSRHEDAWLFIATMSFMILCASWDILSALYQIKDFRLTQTGFFTIFAMIVFMIARRIERNARRTALLNARLQGLNLSFERFVPTQVLHELGKTSALDLDVGDSVYGMMSVLFSDIRSFTSLSEEMKPDENFKFLNSYLNRMEPLIRKHNGFVDKFIGDAIMALFSEATRPHEQRHTSTATAAVLAALEMLAALKEYNSNRSSYNYRPIQIGIGIDTGPLILGTIGSSNRIDTTVVGNTVNIASRLESLTAWFAVQLLVSHSTWSLLENQEQYLARPIGSIQVKGKKEAFLVHEIFDQNASFERELKLSTQAIFQEALQLWKQADFQTAHALFQRVLDQNPSDTIAGRYIQECDRLIHSPPDTSWNGSVHMTVK
ncbi:MAG: adenylate/guanylate cyclase domain-containing protein [Leptospiraceae bacterium]|nr:adenylate/guanylate cyclase domain-containing protein [Leptospiraceae bacterium]